MARSSKYVPNSNQLPLFTPQSNWKPLPPSQWPDFRATAKIIGVDTETYDPNLLEKGPGFVARGDARLMGVSLAAEDGKKIYLPLFHSEDNVEDPLKAIEYLRYQLGGDQVKCGANLMYDMESLWSEGIEMKGLLGDIQIAEPILDEERPGGYSLENLAQAYLGVGKNEELLNEAGASYGFPDNPKKGMHIIPARYIGPYAEDDAWRPIQIYLKQVQALKTDGVWDIFQLERKLQRTLFKMRLKGIRVDVDKADQLSKKFVAEENELYKVIQELSSSHKQLSPSSSDDIGKALKLDGIIAPMTAAGNFSITNEWLQEIDIPLTNTIYEWRKTNKMRKDFIDKLVTDSYKGRIYTSWHQLREFDEDGKKAKGTRSGRIASSKFNMTQVPSRDPKWGKMIRSLFIADEGKKWVKADYSQQEPRILLHFAYIMKYQGAAEARQKYLDNPAIDYHQLVADLVEEKSGKSIGRKNAKDINLGSAYGMGKYKLSLKLGVSMEMAGTILEAYHAGVPYVHSLEKTCTKLANDRGFIFTILKRKRRFLLWEPAYWDRSKGFPPKPIRDIEEAREMWGNVRRAYTNKSLNSLVQGSAADQVKMALVTLDEAGLLPQVQVYDEINGSYGTREEAFEVQRIMESAIVMTVPFLAEPDIGPSWGEVKAA